MRILIERYVTGDTATDAQRYIIDGRDAAALPLLEPSAEEADELVDRFLSIYPSSFT